MTQIPLSLQIPVEDKAIELVCGMFQLAPRMLRSGRRREIVRAKACLAGILTHNGWSQPMLARLLGYADHTTIHHLLRQVLPRILLCETMAQRHHDACETIAAFMRVQEMRDASRDRGDRAISQVVDMLRAHADLRLSRLEAGLREQLARDPDALLQALERLAGEAESVAPLLEFPRLVGR